MKINVSLPFATPAIRQGRKSIYQIDHREVQKRMAIPALIAGCAIAGILNFVFLNSCKNAGHTSNSLKGACPLSAIDILKVTSPLLVIIGIYGLELLRAKKAAEQKNNALFGK